MTGPEAAPGFRLGRKLASDHSAGPQFAETREADARQGGEEISLGGADALGRSLGAGAERAAGGHGVIVRAPWVRFRPVVSVSASTASPPGQDAPMALPITAMGLPGQSRQVGLVCS